jgi:hypothetical protein
MEEISWEVRQIGIEIGGSICAFTVRLAHLLAELVHVSQKALVMDSGVCKHYAQTMYIQNLQIPISLLSH